MSLKYPFVLVLCFVSGFEPALAGTPTAEEIVKTTSDQVIARLRSDREELNAHPERIYDLVDELIIPHFDFASMSKWVLGQNWRNTNDAQKEQFVNQFQTLLVRTYAKALLEYSGNVIKYFPVLSNPDSNLVVVKTEIARSTSTTIPINYSLHVSGGQWKVVDVSIDGVSLISTYRGSFASEIRKNGIDVLISKLTDKNTRSASNEAQ